MNIRELVGALGYTVHVSGTLPFERTLEDGTVKRTDYIVDERARCVWMSREAIEALKKVAT
jgi:hypothetical protein